MRWTSLLLPFTLLGAGLAAKANTATRYEDYQSKAATGSPIKLSDASYKQITSLPRDYSVAVLLTALDSRFACQICREFDSEWKLLSKSWAKGDKNGDSRLLFGVLDFNEGRDTFISVCTIQEHLCVSSIANWYTPHYSSACKPLLSFSSSSLLLASSPFPVPNPYDSTSRLGMSSALPRWLHCII